MEKIALLASIFLFGLAVGSFLNVVIYRTLHGESPFEGRSRCPKCKKTIRAVDNIPLLSYILLRGRCRWCKARIAWSYPVVEFLTASLFVWWLVAGFAFFRLTQSPFAYLQPGFWLIVGLLLVVVFFSDLFYGLIPDVIVAILGFLGLFYRLLLTGTGIMQQADFLKALASGIGVAAFLLSLIVLTGGRGMGMGDAKLSLVLGLILGWPRIMVAVFLSFFLGALVAVFLLLIGKKRFGQTLPFGPFLVVGTVLALLWGERLWGFYFSLFG